MGHVLDMARSHAASQFGATCMLTVDRNAGRRSSSPDGDINDVGKQTNIKNI